MVARFRSKPIEIEAVQFDPSDPEQNLDPTFITVTLHQGASYKLWVVKSDEWCDITPGDWIIYEPDGVGVYPCKQAIFAVRYDRVERRVRTRRVLFGIGAKVIGRRNYVNRPFFGEERRDPKRGYGRRGDFPRGRRSDDE